MFTGSFDLFEEDAFEEKAESSREEFLEECELSLARELQKIEQYLEEKNARLSTGTCG